MNDAVQGVDEFAAIGVSLNAGDEAELSEMLNNRVGQEETGNTGNPDVSDRIRGQPAVDPGIVGQRPQNAGGEAGEGLCAGHGRVEGDAEKLNGGEEKKVVDDVRDAEARTAEKKIIAFLTGDVRFGRA